MSEKWLPIESAPKDGTEVLAYAADKAINGHFYGVAMWADKSEWPPNSVAGWFWPFRIRPTHFQPLPPPPGSET